MATKLLERGRSRNSIWQIIGAIVGSDSTIGAREGLWGIIFLTPWLLGLLFFVAGPILASFFLSFTEYDILSPPRWVGISNYARAFFQDPLFWGSLFRTLYYSAGVVPLSLIGSLLLAMLLNQGLRGTNIYRTMFFLPHLTPMVAMSILWLWLLNPEIGPVNYMLEWMGLPPGFPWFSDRRTVIPSLQLVTLWSAVGGNSMLIFLAGLQGVPQELYEAAEIDGAGNMAKFRRITLPMISPTIFFNLVLGIIGALQVFTMAYVATRGGPSYGSWFFALHIYQNAFRYFRMGYGSALAWVFVVLVMSFTLVNWKLSEDLVYYGGAA